MTFECTVNGGVTIVWKGSGFKRMPTSNDIVLLHSRPIINANGTCDDGELKAHAELEAFGDKYFSWINITATCPFTVSMFTLAYIFDNGTAETIVSNWTVSINNGVHHVAVLMIVHHWMTQRINQVFCRHVMVVLATVMILIGITLGLVHKRKRKLHLQSPIDSSNIYSHTI